MGAFDVDVALGFSAVSISQLLSSRRVTPVKTGAGPRLSTGTQAAGLGPDFRQDDRMRREGLKVPAYEVVKK